MRCPSVDHEPLELSLLARVAFGAQQGEGEVGVGRVGPPTARSTRSHSHPNSCCSWMAIPRADEPHSSSSNDSLVAATSVSHPCPTDATPPISVTTHSRLRCGRSLCHKPIECGDRHNIGQQRDHAQCTGRCLDEESPNVAVGGSDRPVPGVPADRQTAAPDHRQ